MKRRTRWVVALSLVLSLAVTASHAAWTAPETATMSISTAPDFRPIASGIPTVTGTLGIGGLLTGSVAGVSFRSNVSHTEAYQWQLCVSLVTTTCADIPGANALTYVPLGSFFRLGYSSTNSYGTTTVYSAVFS